MARDVDRQKLFITEPKRGEDVDLAVRLLEAQLAAQPGKHTLIEQELAAIAGSSGGRVSSAVPGRQTRVGELGGEGTAAARSRSDEIELGTSAFDRLRSRGRRELVAMLGVVRGGRSLIQAALSEAKRATSPVAPSLTIRPSPPDPVGQAMWRAAERRAVTLYRRAVDGEGLPRDPDVEQALSRIGTGRALPERVRRAMERTLGVPLDRVRIHTDSTAADAARAVRATAFTVGEDIFFADGAFASETEQGAKLLVHELAHVIQAWQGRTETGGDGVRVSKPDDRLEREADAVAEQLHRASREQQTRSLLDDLSTALGFSHGQVEVQVDELARQKTAARGARGLMEDGRVYLHPDRYDPATSAGRQLLAHEMIHVAQARISRADAPATNMPAEAEASYLADQFAQGRGLGRPTVGLPRAAAADNDAERELRGQSVKELGIAYKKEGVNLRDKPSPAPVSQVKKLLPFNTRMFVDSEDNGYYFVTTNSGDFGYVLKSHVKTNPPEPNATIYHIEPGDTALEISRKHYGGNAEWGADHRFFVNGLVLVNQGSGPRGIYKLEADADWDTTKVRSGYMIWVPSLPFMRSLQGRVSSGSITYEAWQTVKQAAGAVAEFLLGAGAFIAGLLHGVLESLWDILVGLKDLAVMAWDILKSLVTGNLLNDAKGLWNDLANLDWGKLVQGWIDNLDAKWNHPSVLTRWHFRGWLIGYVIAEVAMLVFSGGVIQGIKWVGKAAKVTKVLQTLPRIAKFTKIAKESKAAQKLVSALGKGGHASKTAKAAKAFVEGLLARPLSIWGKGPDEIVEVFTKAGYKATIEQSTRGSKLSKQIRISGHKEIANIQVHPGGGRHGGSYYKISTSTRGKIKVVDRKTYKPTPGENATIIYAESGPSGWLLRAVAANAGAQRVGREGAGDDE